MQLIDSHCHLDFPIFNDDFIDVLHRAQALGVNRFLIPGVAAHNWPRVLELAQQYSGIYPALGLHPYFLHEFQTEHLQQLSDLLATQTNIVAVGEIGLDKAIDFDFQQQLQLCRQQLLLAKQYNLPVILHCRKAHNELIQLLQQVKLNLGGVLHGFSGSIQLAQSYIKLGFKLGIGGVITYSRAHKTRDTVAHLPLSTLLLETDAPDMPIAGHQGQPNEPAQIMDIVNELAKLRNEPVKLIADTTIRSFNQLFLVE